MSAPTKIMEDKKVLISDTRMTAIAAFIAVIAVVLINIIRRERLNFWRLIINFAGLWYALTALFFLFKLGTIRFAFYDVGNMRINLTPFKTIAQYFDRGFNLIQVFGNIIVTVPLPILLRLNFSKISFAKIVFIAGIITVLIEPAQLLVNVMLNSAYNSIDIDDLILNSLGTIIGLGITAIIGIFRRNKV